jgi:tricorn protease
MDVAWPAIGPAEIVFQAGGRLHLLDLATEEHHEVPVEVVTDRATLRPRLVDVGEQLASAHISPSGARAVVEARGEIFTLPAEHGVVRQLTRRSGTAERYPAWSPDGSRIAYWSDRTGEYELTLLGAPGDGEEVAVTALGPGFRYRPFWSPDSSKIAFIDNTQTIRIVDVESAEVSDVDQGLYWMHPALTGFEPAWSPDSRWLAWHRQLETGTTQRVLQRHATGLGPRRRLPVLPVEPQPGACLLRPRCDLDLPQHHARGGGLAAWGRAVAAGAAQRRGAGRGRGRRREGRCGQR